MVVRIRTSADVLGRSRFGISPAAEVLGAVRASQRRGPTTPYLSRWASRAAAKVPSPVLDLLTGLVPPGSYVPDLLTPPPTSGTMSIDDEVAAIAGTDLEDVAYQLDIAFRDRRVPPQVAESFGSVPRFEAQRRPMPPAVHAALADGYGAFAERVGEAVSAYFDLVLAPEWSSVLDVLTADVAFRGARMAQRGVLALADDLHPDLRWAAGEIQLLRPFHVHVDWADDGVLLVPSTGTGNRVWFNAEEPGTPSIVYPARGTHQLWPDGGTGVGVDDLGELIGHTRATLLAALDTPRTTGELGRAQMLTASTVSYHLGILHRAGLVARRRAGRRVVYERTDLGTAIMAGRASA